MKTCTICKKEKPLEEFTTDSRMRDGRLNQCHTCLAARLKKNRRERRYAKPTSEYARKARLKSVYGITPKEYNDLFIAQEGRCAICGRHQSEFLRNFAVDHNHETGQKRGLLCINCNTAIGNLRDDTELLKKAIAYLEKWSF